MWLDIIVKIYFSHIYVCAHKNIYVCMKGMT